MPAIAALTNGSYAHAARRGIATSSIARKRRAGSIASRTWARRARSRSTSRTAMPCSCCAPATAIAADARGARRAHPRRGKRQRARDSSPLDRAADAFIVRRGNGQTIIAGYPWFTDWGRDTFIAMRGLVLARGRLDVAASILSAWAELRVRGHAAQSLSRPRRGAGVQRGRRVAVVRDRRARIPGGGRPAPTRARTLRRRDRRRSSTATRAARATASAWTPTACSRAACPACSSRGWTPRSATA